MSFFHNNLIFGTYCDITLQAQKELFKVSFPKSSLDKCILRCEFKDGSVESREFDMNNKDFTRERKEFVRWFENQNKDRIQPNK